MIDPSEQPSEGCGAGGGATGAETTQLHGAAKAARFRMPNGAPVVPANGSLMMSGRSTNSFVPLKLSNEFTWKGWPFCMVTALSTDHPESNQGSTLLLGNS